RPSAEPSGLVAGFADATALSGAAAPPNWQPGAGRLFDAAAVPAVRDHYSQARAKVLAAGS
ncbi:MAG: hypothetical protein ACRDQF_15720, partial [Thermocrispum sp.]